MNILRLLGIAGLITAAYGAPPPPRHYFRTAGALTEASGSPAGEIGTRFIREVAPFHSLTQQDLQSVYLTKEYRTEHNGVTHLLFRQRYAGIDVRYSDFVVNIDSAGRVINAGGNLFSAPSPNAAPPTSASLSPAIRTAMKWADPAASANYTPIEIAGNGKARRFQRFDGSGNIEGRALWYPYNGELVPAWEFTLNDAAGTRQAATIDSVSQGILETQPLTAFQNPPNPPRGLVFTTPSPRPNPRPGFAMTEEPPYVPRVLTSFAGDPQASPQGWVEGSETSGNNIIAGKNPLGEWFLVQPVTAKSATRDFQFPLELGLGAPNPTNYIDSAITNLFYWMNVSHDMFWHAGFNEAAGNYQKQNFGRGGIEGDPIYAYAHFGVQQTFGAEFNNAFYSWQSEEDGSPAMIAMFLGAGRNNVFTDGSYDAEVMVHEYTHGVSRRLVRSLGGHHGGAMGEAWSDFFALEFTTPSGAPPEGVYTSGDYFVQRLNVGIRTRPYSTDMNINPITFADLGRVGFSPAVHLDGGIWVEALLEMRANLIRQFGETEGRRRTRILVIDGMKMSVPGPSMVDARDAILLADQVTFKGESQSQIWQAFAKRGMGVTAYSPSNNTTRVTASFAQPSRTGVLAFAEPSYGLGETVRVILHDANLTDEIVPVQITSYEVGSDVQTIRLRRTGSFYTGTVLTSSFEPATREDGTLSVMPGSYLTAYYNDTDADGGPKQVQASVPTRGSYARYSIAPGYRFEAEQPLNLRSAPGAFLVYDLPWEFPFFGRGYSSMRVLANGLLAFDVPPAASCTDVPALRNITGIAPLYGPFRTNGTAQPNENVYVGRPSEDAISFRWVAETVEVVGGPPQPVNFAATLYRDGKIEFRYGSGNTAVVIPSQTASVCSATPSVGISNGGTASLTVAEYLGRANLENAPPVRFDPPYGASSEPEIRIEIPNAEDPYEGILTGQLIVWDANHFVSNVYVIIDGVFRGQATSGSPRPDVCLAQRLPNCLGISFSYNFADLGLAPGQHTLKVRVMNTRGGMTEREVSFTVAEGQSRPPVVAIEAPAAGGEVSDIVTIRGYAAAPNLRIIGIDVLIDGVSYGRAAYGQPRVDVCGSIGFASPNCPSVGFSFAINSRTSGLPLADGEHLLQVRVQDETGRFTTYPDTPRAFRVNNGPNQAPRGALVTPTHGERVSGTILVCGYAWDPDGRVTSVRLLVDGFARATLRYGESREGECPALPDVAACPNIGFSYEFNTKTVLNGPHVLGIELIDDRGRTVIAPQNAANGLTVLVAN